MEYFNSNNLVMMGASPFLGDAENERAKNHVIQSLVSQGCLPLEITLIPAEDFLHAYWQAIESATRQAIGYVLIVGEKSALFEKAKKEKIEQELSLIKASGLAAAALVHYSMQEEKGRLENEFGFKVYIWGQTRELANFVQQSVTYCRAQTPLDYSDNRWYEKSASFQCFYYSPINLEVRHCWLEVSFKEIRLADGRVVYPVRQQGFHDTYPDEYYSGLGCINSGFLHADLHREFKDHLTLQLNIAGATDLKLLRTRDLFFGSLQGLTSDSKTIANVCYKIIAVKTPQIRIHALDPQSLQVKRHLYLSRKSFITKAQTATIKELPQLALEGGKPFKRAEHLVGAYRIWTEGRYGRNEVAQSRMIIYEDYRVTIENPVFGGQVQDCELCFTEDTGREKLFFVMRNDSEAPGAGPILSVAIIEFPKGKEDLRDFQIGSFCSAGKERDTASAQKGNKRKRKKEPLTEVRGGYFIACLEEMVDIEVGFKPVADMQDPDLVKIYNILRRENGRKSRVVRRKKALDS